MDVNTFRAEGQFPTLVQGSVLGYDACIVQTRKSWRDGSSSGRNPWLGKGLATALRLVQVQIRHPDRQ